MPKSGWQQPPTRKPLPVPQCPHLGLVGAAMSINRHSEGHTWICPCGQKFVVVSNGGRNKKLVKDDS